MAMEELHSKYELFYNELSALVNELATRLKPDAPPELQYVTDVLDILPVDDPDLEYGNEDGILNRARIVVQFTKLIIDRSRQFLDDDNQAWFDNQIQMVKLWMALVEVNLVNVKLDEEETEFFDAGIGGINTGVATYREVNVDNLRALRDTLIASAPQQSV